MADASWGISRETGKVEDEAITFTRQMAALYTPASFDGIERVLEMDYTDRDVRCCVVLGEQGTRVVTDGSVSPTTSVHTPFGVWQEIAQGKISGVDALAEHRYSVTGDFDLMIRWDDFFGDEGTVAVDQSVDESPLRPPTMAAMPIPWVAFWTTYAISPTVGPPATLALCAISSLIFARNERTAYDTLSTAAGLALVAASLAGVQLLVLQVISFVAFGLMWLVSALWFMPLSSYYVKGSYGGDRALSNIIFVRTNRIICLVWGVTYLAAAAATLVAPEAMLAINELLPLPAAVFTVVFQRWYPAHVAKG